ncbi:MAG: ribbon-helix-helix domain-containing protein [Promethearchaeota archaeon]
MPIMSFSIPEELKNFIQSIVDKKKAFKNRSGFVRAALTHYLNATDAHLDLSLQDVVETNNYTITGQIMLSFSRIQGQEHEALKKIYTCELKYADYIESCQIINCNLNFALCIYNFKGSIFDFRNFIDELDSLKEVLQLRYIVNT